VKRASRLTFDELLVISIIVVIVVLLTNFARVLPTP